jgi:hypothetical protein
MGISKMKSEQIKSLNEAIDNVVRGNVNEASRTKNDKVINADWEVVKKQLEKHKAFSGVQFSYVDGKPYFNVKVDAGKQPRAFLNLAKKVAAASKTFKVDDDEFDTGRGMWTWIGFQYTKKLEEDTQQNLDEAKEKVVRQKAPSHKEMVDFLKKMFPGAKISPEKRKTEKLLDGIRVTQEFWIEQGNTRALSVYEGKVTLVHSEYDFSDPNEYWPTGEIEIRVGLSFGGTIKSHAVIYDSGNPTALWFTTKKLGDQGNAAGFKELGQKINEWKKYWKTTYSKFIKEL